MAPFRFALPLLALAAPVAAFNYNLTGAGEISLTDVETTIPGILTIFIDEMVTVEVSKLKWEALGANDTTDDLTLYWETFVGGESQQSGEVDLSELGERELPDVVQCGNLTIGDWGRHEVTVTISVDSSSESTSSEYEAYGAGVAIIPLLVVLFLAMFTQMVEFSLLFAIFVGACIVAGEMNNGFKTTLDVYLLDAIADDGHVYVYLFTLFLSGMVSQVWCIGVDLSTCLHVVKASFLTYLVTFLPINHQVGMMEKSGGMIGFTKAIGQYATTPRAGQFATFVIGCIVFFDDYANTLLAGQTMRPLVSSKFWLFVLWDGDSAVCLWDLTKILSDRSPLCFEGKVGFCCGRHSRAK